MQRVAFWKLIGIPTLANHTPFPQKLNYLITFWMKLNVHSASEKDVQNIMIQGGHSNPKSPKYSDLYIDSQEQYIPFFPITFTILSFAGKETDQIKHFSILRGSTATPHVTWPELQCNFSPQSKHGRDSQVLQQQLQVSSVLSRIKSNTRAHQCS